MRGWQNNVALLCAPRFYFPMQIRQRIRQAAQLVNEPQLHRLLPVDDAADVGGQFAGVEHEFQEFFFFDSGVFRHKFGDPILNPTKIMVY